jgi:hypothetical protein
MMILFISNEEQFQWHSGKRPSADIQGIQGPSCRGTDFHGVSVHDAWYAGDCFGSPASTACK